MTSVCRRAQALLAVLRDHLGTAVDLALALRVAEHAALGGEHELARGGRFSTRPISVSLAPKP